MISITQMPRWAARALRGGWRDVMDDLPPDETGCNGDALLVYEQGRLLCCSVKGCNLPTPEWPLSEESMPWPVLQAIRQAVMMSGNPSPDYYLRVERGQAPSPKEIMEASPPMPPLALTSRRTQRRSLARRSSRTWTS
jgi:hypothetical protein